MAALDATIHQELETLARSQGYELVHAGFAGGTLRLLIDKTGGVTLDDCALISRQASALLDVLEFGQGRYTLWTGDAGLAIYLWHCLDGGASLPALDTLE